MVYLEKGMRRQSIHTVAPKTTREMSVGFKEVFFFFGGGGGPPAAYGVDVDAVGAGGPLGDWGGDEGSECGRGNGLYCIVGVTVDWSSCCGCDLIIPSSCVGGECTTVFIPVSKSGS